MTIECGIQLAKPPAYFHLSLPSQYALVAKDKYTVVVDISSDLVYNVLWRVVLQTATGKMRICGHADLRIEQRVKCGR